MANVRLSVCVCVCNSSRAIYTSVALFSLLFTLLSATSAAFLSVLCKSFWLRAGWEADSPYPYHKDWRMFAGWNEMKRTHDLVHNIFRDNIGFSFIRKCIMTLKTCLHFLFSWCSAPYSASWGSSRGYPGPVVGWEVDTPYPFVLLQRLRRLVLGASHPLPLNNPGYDTEREWTLAEGLNWT